MKVERVCVSPAYGKNGCVVGAFDLDDATSDDGPGSAEPGHRTLTA
jgi:hypothetical protein